jgi:hypothetical protein
MVYSPKVRPQYSQTASIVSGTHIRGLSLMSSVSLQDDGLVPLLPRAKMASIAHCSI